MSELSVQDMFNKCSSNPSFQDFIELTKDQVDVLIVKMGDEYFYKWLKDEV
jgi:2-hydroxy-3-keto-5-methylthiopentenyl-1-phosphate phosphatase